MKKEEIIKKEKKTKQVIVVRGDLNMGYGKMSAQVSHASLGALLTLGKDSTRKESFRPEFAMASWGNLEKIHKIKTFEFLEGSALDQWLSEKFTKVVLECYSQQELELIYYKAKSEGLPCVLITDAGDTFFNEPTMTCVGIGPEDSEKINQITGNLKLYK